MFKFILSLIVLASAPGHASILFEPYAGYTLGQETRADALTSDSATTTGFTYGGRLGFLARHFAILAADYQGMSGKEKFDTQTTSTAWTQSALFACMVFQTMMGFRLLAGYAFNAEMSEAGTPETKFRGDAYKAVLGWVTPMDFAINIEYAIFNLKDSVSAGVTTNLKDTYTKFNYSAASVTLSLPFTFFSGSRRSK